MSANLKIKKELDRVVSHFLFGFEYSNEFLNYDAEDFSKNWNAYESFTMAFTSLKIDWNPKEGFDTADIHSDSLELFAEILPWLHINTINFRFFPPKFFRSSEILHGLVSLLAEKLKINNLLFFGYRKLIDMKSWNPLYRLRNEAYFLDDANLQQAPDRRLYLLLQETFTESLVVELLEKKINNQSHPFYNNLKKLQIHYQAQHKFLTHCFFKLRELNPNLTNKFEDKKLPLLHYREGFPEFLTLFTKIEKSTPNFVIDAMNRWTDFCRESNLPCNSPQNKNFPADFALDKNDQISVVKVIKECQQNYLSELNNRIEKLGIQNDQMIRDSFNELTQKHPLSEDYDTSIYQYYLSEAGKVKWDLQDIYQVMKPLGNLDLSENDVELCDILKEIAYCEGFAYTISHQNLYHAGQLHPFMMWIIQQCHEEMKHFHAVRVLLQQGGVCTQNLDEDFMAQVFEEPDPDAYHDQYNVFNLNFLGEVHNIRAYLLLADAFENENIQKIMRWITDDEVVHKKVFHFHFKHLAKQHSDWEKNAYECMLDTGFGTHQASHCSRYKIMMEKIGKYYNRTGKYSALEFLNMSMRAQYLELKSLYSPNIFKISEFDFRRKHLKAFVH